MVTALRGSSEGLGQGRPWMALGRAGLGWPWASFQIWVVQRPGVLHNLAMVFLDGVEILLQSCDRDTLQIYWTPNLH